MSPISGMLLSPDGSATFQLHTADQDVDLLMKVLRDQYTWFRKRNQEVVPG